MGIPTCSCLAPGFAEKYPEHPFVVLNDRNIKKRLMTLISDDNLRRELGEKGRGWVQQHHDAENVVKKIHQLAGLTKSGQPSIQLRGGFSLAGSSLK